jgi:hypothetical protein
MNVKKSLKFVTLLITALLIGTVSAATYRYMYINGGINVGSAKMIWIAGIDPPTGTTIDGSTAIVALPVEEGTPINFTNCLFLKNNNLTGHFDYTINVTTEVQPLDFDVAKMHIYTNSTGNWVFVHTLDLTTAGAHDSYSGSLDAGKVLRMTVEVSAATGAAGNKPFNLQVAYT